MYWIMVVGPNQNRCRGRCGLSVGSIQVCAGVRRESGPVIDTSAPDVLLPQVKSGP